MARAKPYQVKDNRFLFRCEECGSKRSLAVPPHIRSKAVHCHKCGAYTRCALNRRLQRREEQCGKATMILPGGKEFPIDLNDISDGGVGVCAAPGGGRMLNLSWEVKIKCSWNSGLFSNGRYVIKSIKGDRIGIENISRRPSW